jgi:hypothetical protein
MKQILDEIAFLVKGMVGNEYLYFSNAMRVKAHPHDYYETFLWGVCVDPRDNVYVMDGMQEWTKLDEDDRKIIQSLYQRVSLLSLKYKQTA